MASTSGREPDGGDWWLFQQLSAGGRDERLELDRQDSPRSKAAWRAYWLVEESIDRGGEEALELVLRLLDTAPDDQGQVTLGTGPLEDLITAHSDALATRIEELARRRPDFAASLARAALDEGTLRADTVSRLARFRRTG